MMEKHEKILMSAFVAMESAHAYSAFLPSIFTIRTFGHAPGTAKSIRDGEIIGTAFALGLGGIVSKLIDSWMPLLFAGATSAIMVGVYEAALRTRPVQEGQQPVLQVPASEAVIDTAFVETTSQPSQVERVLQNAAPEQKSMIDQLAAPIIGSKLLGVLTGIL
jgi:hypothetical protein